MSPRTEKQFEEIRQEKKSLILETALELFAFHGYESTSIDQIAKKANISKGLLYNYYKSKEELLETILHKGIDELMAIFDPNKDGVLEQNELKFFINEIFKTLQENRVFWKLYLSVSMQASVFKIIEKRIEEFYEPMMQMLTEYFKNAGFENPFMETIIFGAFLDGITLNYVMKPEMFPIEDIKKELLKRYCVTKTKKS